MYVCMVIHKEKVRINRARLPILLVVSCVDQPLSSTGRARDDLDGASDLSFVM